MQIIGEEMDIAKITVGSTEYDVKDAVARKTLTEHEAAMDSLLTKVTLTASDDGDGTVTLSVRSDK